MNIKRTIIASIAAAITTTAAAQFNSPAQTYVFDKPYKVEKIAPPKGKKVKNPQTGVMITLPGKSVGTVKVIMTGGDTPETEYSFVEVTSNETIDSTNMSNYIIEQAK